MDASKSYIGAPALTPWPVGYILRLDVPIRAMIIRPGVNIITANKINMGLTVALNFSTAYVKGT
jgi:hypothetical protein